MDFKIVWTDPSLADLQEIVTFIASDDTAAAERVGHAIIDHVETLRAFPFIGPPYPRGTDGTLREIVCGNYRIFYRVSEKLKLIEILTVWHGARGTPQVG
ncbi:MAG: type II toxin-antitoxin system RelE/ParE family toxin [Chthoniobacteraceae bacterium]